jgi:hypothetical protein
MLARTDETEATFLQSPENEVAMLWQSALMALGALERCTHHAEYRRIMTDHTNFGNASAARLVTLIIYERLEATIKAE